MTRLQNIMDSLEPAVMGKVEDVIAKHSPQLKSESNSNKVTTDLCNMTLAQLEGMDMVRERYSDLRNLVGLGGCGARNYEPTDVDGGISIDRMRRASHLLVGPVNQGIVGGSLRVPFMSLGIMG